MSTLETNLIRPSTGTSLTIGESGDTITIPSGATITNSGTATGFGGITMVDAWRLTTAYQGDATISSNLERVDAPSGYGTIGTGMSESSGAFTFPSTGIYKVSYFQSFYSASPASRFVRCAIKVATDNSTYNEAALGQTSVEQLEGSTTYCFASCETIVDVTDTSNVKVKFRNSGTISGNAIRGNSSYMRTGFIFTRIGDT